MKKLSVLIIALIATSAARADIFYDWVNLPGSLGGSGFMRLSETNITDPANFDVFFNPVNVLEVQFTFNDGVNIADGVNFDPLSTLQNDPVLNDGAHELIASNGTISTGWTFRKGPGTPVLTYVGTNDQGLLCVVAPCPLFNNHVIFTGPLIPRAFGIGEWHLRPVPLPTPFALLAGGLVALLQIRRRRASV